MGDFKCLWLGLVESTEVVHFEESGFLGCQMGLFPVYLKPVGKTYLQNLTRFYDVAEHLSFPENCECRRL